MKFDNKNLENLEKMERRKKFLYRKKNVKKCFLNNVFELRAKSVQETLTNLQNLLRSE